jgi:hypothetical protein
MSRRLVARSGSEQFELLGQGRLRIKGILRLLFAHHMDHLDAAEDRPWAINGLEPEHQPHPSLDGPMILLNPIVQVAALANPDRRQLPSRLTLELIGCITGQDRLAVGLTAVDPNPFGPAMPLAARLRNRLAAAKLRRSLN